MATARQTLAIAALFFALIGLAYVAPGYQAGFALRPGPRGLMDFRLYDTLTAALILAAPAFCLFTLRRPTEPMGTWRLFWTFGLFAFLVHLGLEITRDGGVREARWPELIVTVWWGLDVLLAWVVADDVRWVRIERGLLHVVLFVGFAIAAVVLRTGLIRVLGSAMIVAVLGSAVYRVVVYTFDATSLTGRLFTGGFAMLNRFIAWYDLPTPLGVLNLAAFREVLRAENLHDTSGIPVSNPSGEAQPPPYQSRFLVERELDGHFNDLAKTSMGSASTAAETTRDSTYFTRSHPGARFGRNVPLADTFPDEGALMTPNPRLVSARLLARDTFKPATTLNLLAAAWIQFETHDWFNHGEPLSLEERGDKQGKGEADPFALDQYTPFAVDLPSGEKSLPPEQRWYECPMRVRRSRPDPTRDYAREMAANKGALSDPPSFANAESHWWDGSQIYGSNPATTERLREGPDGHRLKDGHLATHKGRLPIDPESGDVALSGFTGNWWAGLSILHLLFTKEHNAICDRLRRECPNWDDDKIFDVARLINSALMAKIHTTEWTPAILGHPALQVGMAANWWGLLGEKVRDLFGRFSQNESFSGILGSGVDHHNADYCLTEEFVSVYRMHSLIPDELKIVSAADDHLLGTFVFPEGVVGPEGSLDLGRGGATETDLFYSFGVSNPGAITLHNFPNFLRALKRPKQFGVEEVVDLATIDVLRDRERGVPRYNRFRELVHRGRVRTFAEITDNPVWARELEEVYEGDVDKVDLIVGMFAETPPPGFGFSDTAFRIFILMASRRLKSDRFLAGNAFTPEVYTQAGLDWLEGSTMVSVLLRHYPDLAPALLGTKNAFAPWNRTRPPGTGWKEVFLGGSPEAEARARDAFQSEIRSIQRGFQTKDHAPVPHRAFHAKAHLGIANALFRPALALPDYLVGVGPFQPGREWPMTVRLSNANGRIQADRKPNGRGFAMRIKYDGAEHDLLLSNSPVSHARDAREFMIVGQAAAGSILLALPRIVRGLGLREAIHMARILLRSATRPVRSLASETYWSRTPYAVGAHQVAVKFVLKPTVPLDTRPIPSGDNYLRADLVERLRQADLRFELFVQRYIDEARTPLEDGTAEWSERDSAPLAVATLILPRQDLATPEAAAAESMIDGLAFNPWHVAPGVDYRPLGSLNRSRQPVYASSAAGRLAPIATRR